MPLLPAAWRVLAGPPSLASCSRDVYDPALRLSPETALQIASGIAAATAHLHQRGVMRRLPSAARAAGRGAATAGSVGLGHPARRVIGTDAGRADSAARTARYLHAAISGGSAQHGGRDRTINRGLTS